MTVPNPWPTTAIYLFFQLFYHVFVAVAQYNLFGSCFFWTTCTFHALATTKVQNNHPLHNSIILMLIGYIFLLNITPYNNAALSFKDNEAYVEHLHLPRLTETDFVFRHISNPYMKQRSVCKSYSPAWYSLNVTLHWARTSQHVKLHLPLIWHVLSCTLFLLPDVGSGKEWEKSKEVFHELIWCQSS